MPVLETVPSPGQTQPGETKPIITESIKQVLGEQKAAEKAGGEGVTPVVPEAVVAEPKKPEDEASGSRFAALVTREKKLVKRDQDLKAREQAIADREKAIAEDEELWKKAPLKAVEKKGFSYQKLTDIILNDDKPTPEMIAQQVYEENRKKEREADSETAKQEAERLKAEAEEENKKTLSHWKKNVSGFIDQNKEDYELIHLYGASEIVCNVISTHYQNGKKAYDEAIERGEEPEKPKVMTTKEASDELEKFFVEQLDKIEATKKFQARKTAAPKEGDKVLSPEADKKTSSTAPTRTINNQMQPSTPASRPLTRDERVKRAMAVGKG